jgi:hypothetical protein
MRKGRRRPIWKFRGSSTRMRVVQVLINFSRRFVGKSAWSSDSLWLIVSARERDETPVSFLWIKRSGNRTEKLSSVPVLRIFAKMVEGMRQNTVGFSVGAKQMKEVLSALGSAHSTLIRGLSGEWSREHGPITYSKYMSSGQCTEDCMWEVRPCGGVG